MSEFGSSPPVVLRAASSGDKGCLRLCKSNSRVDGLALSGTRQKRTSEGWSLLKRETTTLGWLPSCGCKPNAVPGICLDPFGGAGTTGLVADRLGRNAILIELNGDYAAMAERRLKQDAGMFAEVVS